jgi:hypothetical protein
LKCQICTTRPKELSITRIGQSSHCGVGDGRAKLGWDEKVGGANLFGY